MPEPYFTLHNPCLQSASLQSINSGFEFTCSGWGVPFTFLNAGTLGVSLGQVLPRRTFWGLAQGVGFGQRVTARRTRTLVAGGFLTGAEFLFSLGRPQRKSPPPPPPRALGQKTKPQRESEIPVLLRSQGGHLHSSRQELGSGD